MLKDLSSMASSIETIVDPRLFSFALLILIQVVYLILSINLIVFQLIPQLLTIAIRHISTHISGQRNFSALQHVFPLTDQKASSITSISFTILHIQLNLSGPLIGDERFLSEISVSVRQLSIWV